MVNWEIKMKLIQSNIVKIYIFVIIDRHSVHKPNLERTKYMNRQLTIGAYSTLFLLHMK